MVPAFNKYEPYDPEVEIDALDGINLSSGPIEDDLPAPKREISQGARDLIYVASNSVPYVSLLLSFVLYLATLFVESPEKRGVAEKGAIAFLGAGAGTYKSRTKDNT